MNPSCSKLSINKLFAYFQVFEFETFKGFTCVRSFGNAFMGFYIKHIYFQQTSSKLISLIMMNVNKIKIFTRKVSCLYDIVMLYKSCSTLQIIFFS